MKKFILSSSTLVLFALYSIYQRGNSPSLPIVPLENSSTQSLSQQSGSISQPPPVFTPTPSPSSPQPFLPSSIPLPPSPTPTPTHVPSGYRDGTYVGDAADAFYGMIQVQAQISGGRIASVQFLQYPNDRSTSIYINSQADPLLAQEAISAQSANVDTISGATDSSQAFIQSLQSALSKAKG